MADRAPGESDGDPVAIRSGYERLRSAVLSGRPDGFALGHGVLVTRGTVAWIASVTEAAVAPAARGGGPEPVSSPSALPAAGEIVVVLAHMAFAIAA
ncbi:MAG: hypothetical protein ACR2OB_03095 [Solirubrobacteraceae bacterium]